MLLSPRKNALTSLFKEARVFKEGYQKRMDKSRSGSPHPIPKVLLKAGCSLYPIFRVYTCLARSLYFG